jgi:ABC-type antimicrobial peptide transport system permease subunit
MKNSIAFASFCILTMVVSTSAYAVPGFGTWTINTPLENWSRADYLSISSTGNTGGANGTVRV